MVEHELEQSDWFRGGFYYTYVLRSCSDGNFYIGFTNDLERRVMQHQRGENISTSKRLPVELVYFEGHKSKHDAMRRKEFKTTKGKVTLKQVLRDSLNSSGKLENRKSII